jgi:hypothetical protein
MASDPIVSDPMAPEQIASDLIAPDPTVSDPMASDSITTDGTVSDAAKAAVEQALGIFRKAGYNPRSLLWMCVEGTAFRTAAMELLQGVTPSVLSSEFHSAFEKLMKGIPCARIDPSAFKVGRSRDATYDEFSKLIQSKKLNPDLVLPFCFQTSDGKGEDFAKNSLFWFFQHAEDALLKLMFMLSAPGYMYNHNGHFYPVTQVYEHQVKAEIACMQIDLEVQMQAFLKPDGTLRMNKKEVYQVFRTLPRRICERLYKLGYVDEGTEVTTVYKDKSRPTGADPERDYKVSAHVTVEIGAPPSRHASVLKSVLAPYRCVDTTSHIGTAFSVSSDTLLCFYRGVIQMLKKERNATNLSDEEIKRPWFAVDEVSATGNQGFSIMGGLQKTSDQMPTLKYRERFVNGKLVGLPERFPRWKQGDDKRKSDLMLQVSWVSALTFNSHSFVSDQL